MIQDVVETVVFALNDDVAVAADGLFRQPLASEALYEQIADDAAPGTGYHYEQKSVVSTDNRHTRCIPAPPGDVKLR